MTKKILIYIIIIISFNTHAQNISEINKVLELPDTLSYKHEIRIYKKYETSYSTEIFRMYDEGNNNWKAQIFYFSNQFKSVTKITEIEFPKEVNGTLKPKDAYLIWLQLLLCDIEYLPSIEQIKYKLKKSSIIFEDGGYEIVQKHTHILDGNSYKVFIRNYKIKNDFSFTNPESYLNSYPDIDELQSYTKLLSIIKKEFNLWNE